MKYKLINKISEAICGSILPANEAHRLMLPYDRPNINDMKRVENSVNSSVMILLYHLFDENYGTVLIRRQDYKGVHGGQIAFPGGKQELTDLSLEHTAIRETLEEIGVKVSFNEIIGRLSTIYIPPSNFLLTPIVAFKKKKPDFKINNYEVKEILELSIKELLDEKKVSKDVFKTIYGYVEAPCFNFELFKVWGATAMIINEFKEIILKNN